MAFLQNQNVESPDLIQIITTSQQSLLRTTSELESIFEEKSVDNNENNDIFAATVMDGGVGGRAIISNISNCPHSFSSQQQWGVYAFWW